MEVGVFGGESRGQNCSKRNGKQKTTESEEGWREGRESVTGV